MKYTVKRIDEDLDFGCEERAADAPGMAVVTLIDPAGQEMKLRQPDQMLYDRDINEGDEVILNERNELQKALDEGWTKNCTTKTVDTTKFVDMMQAVKSGKKIDWGAAGPGDLRLAPTEAERRCPFCGGRDGLMEQENGHTVIGCDSCDMRISTSQAAVLAPTSGDACDNEQ